MINANWQRWIFASVGKHFTDAFTAPNVPIDLFIEDEPRKTDPLKDWVELRMNGPLWEGATQDEWVAKDFWINIFIGSKFNPANNADNYRIHKNIGLVCAAFTTTIPVFKLGDLAGDDSSYLTCLTLRTEGKQGVMVNQLGRVTPQTPLQRATVEACYFGNFYG